MSEAAAEPLRCPVCRADNTAETCRRCRADLSLLAALAARRRVALARAARAAAAGDGAAAVRYAQAAREFGAGADALRWLAVGWLLQGDHARALAYHRQASSSPNGAQ